MLWTPSKDLLLPPLLWTPREEEPHSAHETNASLTQRPYASHSLWGPGFGIGVSLSTRWIPSLQIWPFLLCEYCILLIGNNGSFKTNNFSVVRNLSVVFREAKDESIWTINALRFACLALPGGRCESQSIPGWAGTHQYCLCELWEWPMAVIESTCNVWKDFMSSKPLTLILL